MGVNTMLFRCIDGDLEVGENSTLIGGVIQRRELLQLSVALCEPVPVGICSGSGPSWQSPWLVDAGLVHTMLNPEIRKYTQVY
jgi:hypothetical protein